MSALVSLILLATVTIVSVWMGERTHLPYPVLLFLMVTVLAFIPAVPTLVVEPDVVLALFLPPLIFAVARKTSWSVFRQHWRTLLVMSLGLTAVTAFAVAGAVSWLVPGMGFPLALVLGALVAPNDPVALEAVAEPARVPRGIMRTLQTESLFNDAVAIVLFSVAVTSVDGAQSLVGGLLAFVASFVVAFAVGFAVGWVVSFASRSVRSAAASGGVSMIAPFAAYVLSEHLYGSGVIAVVVAALEIGRREVGSASSDRLTTSSFWEVVEMLVNGVAFGLMGFQMRGVVASAGWDGMANYLGIAAIVVVVLFAVRALFTWILYLIARRRGGPPRDWRDCVVIVWCGMRALTTMALALSLPAWVHGDLLEYRGLIIVVAAVVLFITLVPAGLLLPWLIRKLRPVENREAMAEEAEALTDRVMRAAQEAVDEYAERHELADVHRDSLNAWVALVRSRLVHQRVRVTVDPEAPQRKPTAREVIGSAHTVALEAAREEALRARNDPTVDVAIVEHILHNLDLRTVALPQFAAHRSLSQPTSHSGTGALAQRRGRLTRAASRIVGRQDDKRGRRDDARGHRDDQHGHRDDQRANREDQRGHHQGR